MILPVNGNCNPYRLRLFGDTLEQSLSPLVSWKMLFIPDIGESVCRNSRYLISLDVLVDDPSGEPRFLGVS